MAVRNLSDIVGIGLDVLKTSLSTATNLIVAQLGNAVTQVATSDDAEWWQHVGFASRPRVPTPGQGAAQVVVITRSDHDAVIASKDDRAAGIYGQLADGETAVFASVVGGGLAVFKADGSIVVTAGDNQASVTIKAGGEVDVFGTTIKLGDSGAVPLARADKVATELGKIALALTAVSAGGGALTGLNSYTTPGSVAATKVSGT